MLVIRILILILLLIVIPTMAGGIFDSKERGIYRLLFRWVSGQTLLWAGFQLICVPLILHPRDNNFQSVMILFNIYAVAAMMFSMGVTIRREAKYRMTGISPQGKERDWIAGILFLLVVGLLILQQVLAVTLAYGDGDDAFYVAVSSMTAESGTMYEILPYTGGSTILDARHGLAPFPIWVAMLAKESGLHAATVSQIVLPIVLIAMSYAILALIGKRLFAENRRARLLFLLLLEALVMFGGQSICTAENFLLARTAQGKAVLANIVIPFVFLLLLLLFERLESKQVPEFLFWLLFGMALIAGCLCSTLGTLFVCLLLAVGGVCAVFCYRKWKILPLLAACGIVPMIMAILYLTLD